MTQFLKQGSTFKIIDNEDLTTSAHLPVGTYGIGQDQFGGYFLRPLEPLRMPNKLYGSTRTHAERILQTFQQRDSNTGILLSGEKGSGKTMLMRVLSNGLATAGMPTILIDEKHHGANFNKFIQGIDQPCLIGIDEFEKTYGATSRYASDDTDSGSASQNSLLTLLDGVFTGKKLFVFTCNSIDKVSKHMLNRPGRIFYHIRYRGLDENIVAEYAAERLKNTDHLPSLMAVAGGIDSFNFDMLQAMVEEMNRYNEDAYAAQRLMNVRPETSPFVNYECVVTKDNEVHPSWGHGTGVNPLAQRVTYVSVNTGETDKDGEAISKNLRVGAENLKSKAGNKMIFEQDGYTITYTRERYSADY